MRVRCAVAALVAVAAGSGPALAAPGDVGELWRWAAAAVGQMVDGDLPGAFAALARARAARALPEVEALAGLAAMQGGERAAARRRLREAAERRSDQALVYYWAGRSEFLSGRSAASLQRMEQAVSIGDVPSMRLGHALLLLEAGQKERAVSSLAAAAASSDNLLDPSLFPAPLEGAVDLLEPLFRGFPSKGKLLRTQGHLLWRSRRVLAAQRRFVELIRLDSEDADALQMLARTQAAVGEEQEAVANLEKALRLSPGMPQALAGRGELLLEQGRAARAVADLRRAADALPRDARLLTRLGEACLAAEDPQCARRFFSYAVVRDGRLAAAHFGLGVVEQQAGAPAKAREHLRRALALEPGASRTYQAMAQLESATGDRAQARRWLGEARRAASCESEHRRRLQAAKKDAKRQAAALRELSKAPRCESSACRTALARLGVAPRTFLQAHLAIKRGDSARALGLLRGLAVRLHARQLLLGDPTLIETACRTAAGGSYKLQSFAPMIPSSRFR